MCTEFITLRDATRTVATIDVIPFSLSPVDSLAINDHEWSRDVLGRDSLSLIFFSENNRFLRGRLYDPFSFCRNWQRVHGEVKFQSVINYFYIQF